MSQTADADIIPLTTGFTPASREAWLAQVEKTLKGQSLDTLVSRTLEGLAIEPLYDRPLAARPPGRAAAGPQPWDVRTTVSHPTVSGANAQILQDLTGGASSVLLRIDPSGETGIAVGSAEDLARTLDGVLLDLAPVALDAGFLGSKAADWLASAAKAAPAAPLALHMDPLSAFAVAGESPGPIESHLIACATVGARLAEPYPLASLFLASGRPAHEAGGGDACELAMMAASALAYAKALVRAGLPMQAAFERLVLGLSADADYFAAIAKLRAARLIWARLTGACGVETPARIEARASGRMLTRSDPDTNMVRLTIAGFAAAVGGADAVVLGAFTDALGRPSALARRQARNAQLVLMEEANVGRVADPAAGCGYVEALTDELAREGWARFQAIEAGGGIIAALESGLVAGRVAEARQTLSDRIAAGEMKLLGVTQFRPAEAAAVELDEVPAQPVDAPSPRRPGPDSHCPPLTPVTLEALPR